MHFAFRFNNIAAGRHDVRRRPTAAVVLALFLVAGLKLAAQETFHVNRDLYSTTADPATDIAAALKTARAEHKRVLLEFGGNWCSDCQLLDYYYHQAPNADLLAKHLVVVRVDIGHMDHNMDIASRYRVPVAKGVPALAVLDASGKLLYTEHDKEFEHTSPEAITAFLNRWKG